MRRCIVLSGQYRTFDQTWKNIRNFIDLNGLDVYCHLWSTSEEEKNNVIDRLEPKKILVEDNSLYTETFNTIEKNILQNNPKGVNQDRLSGNASMNYSRRAAYDLIDKDEYDYLVYCRYDIGFRSIFKFENNIESIITPLEESYNLISDIFAIMPMKMADSYFLYEEYERLQSTKWEPEFLNWLRNIKKYPERDIQTHIHTRYCPHMLLMRNILMSGNSFATADIPIYLQR